MESNIVFDNELLKSHSVYKKGFDNKLNELSIRDYKTGGFINIDCIDLDRYEECVYSNSKDNTMDSAIGISNYQYNRMVNRRLLLVELRLGYKSTKNFSASDLCKKSSHSRLILGGEINIDPNDYFVFDKKIINQSERKVNSLAIESGKKGRWHCLTVDGFNNLILDAAQLPYQPMNDPKYISEELFLYKNDIEKLMAVCSRWLNEARENVTRYNIKEVEVICNTSMEVLDKILLAESWNNEEEKWYIEEMISDFEGVLNSVKKD